MDVNRIIDSGKLLRGLDVQTAAWSGWVFDRCVSGTHDNDEQPVFIDGSAC